MVTFLLSPHDSNNRYRYHFNLKEMSGKHFCSKFEMFTLKKAKKKPVSQVHVGRLGWMHDCPHAPFRTWPGGGGMNQCKPKDVPFSGRSVWHNCDMKGNSFGFISQDSPLCPYKFHQFTMELFRKFYWVVASCFLESHGISSAPGSTAAATALAASWTERLGQRNMFQLHQICGSISRFFCGISCGRRLTCGGPWWTILIAPNIGSNPNWRGAGQAPGQPGFNPIQVEPLRE